MNLPIWISMYNDVYRYPYEYPGICHLQPFGQNPARTPAIPSNCKEHLRKVSTFMACSWPLWSTGRCFCLLMSAAFRRSKDGAAWSYDDMAIDDQVGKQRRRNWVGGVRHPQIPRSWISFDSHSFFLMRIFFGQHMVPGHDRWHIWAVGPVGQYVTKYPFSGAKLDLTCRQTCVWGTMARTRVFSLPFSVQHPGCR